MHLRLTPRLTAGGRVLHGVRVAAGAVPARGDAPWLVAAGAGHGRPGPLLHKVCLCRPLPRQRVRSPILVIEKTHVPELCLLLQASVPARPRRHAADRLLAAVARRAALLDACALCRRLPHRGPPPRMVLTCRASRFSSGLDWAYCRRSRMLAMRGLSPPA
jgi:hypothetical protein